MTLNIQNRLAVAAVTRGVAKVWAVRDDAKAHPEFVLKAPDDQRHNHFREVQRNDNKGVEKVDRVYFEEIAALLAPAKEILLVGHGTGKANEMHQFRQFLDDHFPAIAAKVVAEEVTHLESMSDPEIVVFAQKWFDNPVHAR